MRQATRWAWGLLALTVIAAGCTKLRDEVAKPVERKAAVGLMAIPPQTAAMKLTVTATSSAGPITLYLAPSADAEAAMLLIEAGKDSPKVLFKSTQGSSVTLEGTMPINTDCTVIAFNDGDQKTEVKASVIGK
jgi:hypothetical protein